MDHQFETERWPVVPAKNFTKNEGKRKVRLIVMHSMEAVEKDNTAEVIANYFHTTDKKVSAHLCIDNNSIIQCVLDNDVAWAAPGANSDGIQIEMAGFAKQSEGEWRDQYSTLVLENAANAAAQYCLKYDIPVRHLNNTQLADKTQKGIVSHAQVSEVFKKSNHTDPGKGFPWEYFLQRVTLYYNKHRPRA